MEPFNYLGSLITSVARRTLEIKRRNSMAKSTSNKKTIFFIIKSDLKCNEWTNEMLHLDHSFIWCWKRVHFGKQIWNTWNDLNVVLEKDGEDQSGRSCETWRSVKKSQADRVKHEEVLQRVRPIVWNMKKCYKESGRSCETWRSVTKSQRNELFLHAIEGRKANWICHIFHSNFLVKHLVEGKINGRENDEKDF